MFGKKEKEFTFRYASGFEGKDYPARCVFSPSYFDSDPTVLDARLCRASICLALSAFGSNEADPAKNIISFLSSVGCKKIDVNPDYRLAPHPRTIGLALGQRRLGFRRTLFVLGVRGSNYQGEWGGNFLLGPSGPHQGFDLAAEKAFAFLKSRALKRSGKRVLWISGYSRAGAVANMTAAKAIDSGLFDAVCCYCFEAPAGYHS